MTYGRELLLARALGAFREGRAAQWTPPPTGPTAERVEREENRAFKLGPFTTADRSTLLNLAAPREHALALARAKRLDEADASMKVAQLLLSLARLSIEGRAYAETMHQAAESYLSYQRGNYVDAHARMAMSIEATDRLATSWGDTDFIVCRRVDLAHNLMRVEMRRGLRTDAMRRGARLLEYIVGVQQEGARLDPRVSSEPPLDAGVSRILFDLIMGTIAELVAPLQAHEATALLSLLSRLRDHGTSPSPHASTWLDIRWAALENDPERFLTLAEPFLRAGRGRTPSLWYAVVLDLTRVYSALDLDDDLVAFDEMEHELRTGPRAPTCMRAASREATVLSAGNDV
jgi:hypothetical protein